MSKRTSTRGISGYLRDNALACVALFFALTGGVAWATHPGGANTIDSADIIDGEVRTDDIGSSEVTAQDIASSAVNTDEIGNDEVKTADVLNDSLRSIDILDGQIRAIDVAFGTLRGDEILDESIGGNDIVGDSIRGEDINESTLSQVPQANQASSAYNANHAESLVFNSVYVKTASVVVPGGSQTDSNGNGFSRAVSVACNLKNGINRDMAVGGGAFWSGNPNSNSDDLENRIHSAAFLDSTGDVATAGEFPFGYRVRGEVDKDGDDTLTVQVVCLRTFP